MERSYRKMSLRVILSILSLLSCMSFAVSILSACGSERSEPMGGGASDSAVADHGGAAATGHPDAAGGVAGSRDNTPVVLEPSADGEVVYEAEGVCVDASNLSEGYVMICYTGSAQTVRLLLDTPMGATYQYRLPEDGSYGVFPMSDGNGIYRIGVYENVSGDKYAELFSQELTVSLTDEKKVFLYPNRYVDFNSGSEAVKKSAEIVAAAGSDLEAVQAVFAYVTQHVSYDYDKAATVQSGYLPVVDETLQSGKGICFDYSSLMAAMLRSQRIPTRLEIGYAGTLYHAWISVYIEEQGWIEDYIVFDGTDWVLMDPTLVSSAKAAAVKKQMEQADTYYEMQYKY